MKLNVGCGYNILEDYINIDRVETTPYTVQKDILKLDYPSGVVDEIYMRHVIEHFFEDEIRDLLANCYRMLKDGGQLILETPDFERIVYAWQEGILDKDLLNKLLFGFAAAQNTREREMHMLHKFAFDEDLMIQFLAAAGFQEYEFEKGAKPSDYDPKYGEYLVHMKVVATK